MASNIQEQIGKSHGQRVPTLIKVITNTLKNYPDGSQILKELIQNADDAGASEVKFLLDETSHSTDQLIDPSVAKYQGPALYVWNNGVFQEEDWEGIIRIGDSGKENKLLKVGRSAFGFISVYHLTDFPCILSNTNILMLDPHMIFDRAGGRLIDLKEFTAKETIASHYECFHDYFGYKGSHQYNGTIFRFPLRIEGYKTKLSNKIYNPAEVLTSLFTPFKRDIENCLLFMKSVNKITVSVKSSSGTEILYSAEVSVKFRDGLAIHREEIFEFVRNEHYLSSTQIYISVFPIHTMDTEQRMRLWVVINMLGFGVGNNLKSSYEKQPDCSYLPWFAIALPLPHNQNTITAIDNVFCWSVEYTNFPNVFHFLQSLPCISVSNVVENFVGNLFCFLPIATNSSLPFHIHGYFVLATNRQAIKWPRHDDLSVEARWNRNLVDALGTVCYAVLVHLMVSRVRSDEGNMFHYDLWRCNQTSNDEDQLECVLHRGAFKFLQNTELVWSITGKNWVKLETGYYLPSVVNTGYIPHENICRSLLLLLQQPLIDVPHNVANSIVGYDFLKNKVINRIVDPSLIRSLLIRFKDGLTTSLKNQKNVCCLLEIVLFDVNFSANNINTILQHIPLIPVCNSEVPMEFGSQARYFISEGPQDYPKIFPGLVSSFIKRDLPSHTHQSLLSLSRTGQINIEDITNFSNKPVYFVQFLECSMKAYFNLVTNVVWRPNTFQQPDISWIESVWKFIDQDRGLIHALQTKELTILPKQSLTSTQIELLPLNATHMPYIQHNSGHDYSKIEKLLTECGCHVCHHHVFILPFHNLVYPPIPQGLFSILQQHQLIQQTFILKLSQADDSIKLAVIDIIMSTTLTGQQINITKSFSIFRSISNNWIRINTFYPHYIPPDSLPRDFTDYPNTFLSPYDVTNTDLCMKLRIARISITQSVQLHLLPLITKNVINKSQSNILSLWILRNISQLDNKLINILQTSKWILDSSKSICEPQQLYDPTDEIFTQLIPSKEQQGIFPDSFYDRQISSLRSLGLLTSQTISYHDLEYIIRVTLRNVSQVERDDYIKWINSLVDLVSLHMDRLKLTQRPNFWEIFHQTAFILPSTRDQCTSYPKSLPYYNSNSCLYPRDVIFCKEKESSLVAGVIPVFLENSYQPGKQRTVCTKMGMPHNIPVNLVCQQLTLITQQTRYNHNEVHSLVKKIYKYFANIILLKGDLRSINLPGNFVFIPEHGFFTTKHVVMSCDDKFFPHIFSLSKHYPIYEDSLADFFKTFDIDIEVGMTKCILVLNKLNTFMTLSVKNASLACMVIQLIGELLNGPYRDNILMLAQDNRLYLAVECVFNDLTWLKRSELSTNKPIVHRNISNIIASKLGCKPASIELAPTAESISYSFLTAAGQTEDLVDRLRGILEGYRMSADVFNELIQNSDDAGASCVKVLFDYTSHPATTVLQENMEEIHGPAMYLFNNAKFTERDFESILKLSSCNKLSDTEKIGRFGVGFNAVYNFTDCPSFVSGDSVQIFDPLQRYVYKLSNAAGIRLCFANDATATETFTDQFRVYQDIFNCDILNQQEYNHTLFRLPFRLKQNKLSNQTYNEDRIKQLQSLVMNGISNFILFLQNIHCIEIYERKHSNIPMKLLLSVTKDDCTTTRFLQNHKEYFKSYKNQLTTGIRPPIQTSADKLTVYTDYHGTKANTSKSYLIAYASGVGDCYDVMRRFDVDKITFLPLCGVAFPLDFLQKIPENLLCKIYTFLPLPIRSPLCLNINCYFSLTDSRKHLNDAFVGDGITSQNDILTDWNLALINDALSNALICALEELVQLYLFCENVSLVSNYYSIWPVKESTNILWKNLPEHFARKIVELFPATKLFLSAHINACISFQDISFLTLENYLIQNTEFTKFVYELSSYSNIIFANIPDSFYSSAIFKIFSEHAPRKIFNLQRLCNEIIFPQLHILPLQNLILIFSTLVPLCSVDVYTWLFDQLIEIEFIPCGSGGNNSKLRKPRDVVCPNTRLSTLYQPEEMRIPVPEMNDFFALDQPTPISNVLKRMCVIYDKLPEEEVVCRCEITSKLSVEEATSHAITLIEYLDTLDKTTLISINHLVKDIPFVPTYHDELFDILQIPLKQFVAPIECYKFHCHHLVTPLFPAASNIFTCLSLMHSPKIDVVFEVLYDLISNVALIAQHNIVIQEKVLQIYKFLSNKVSPQEQNEIIQKLSCCQWIWHPSNKQFYASNQVILSHSQSLPDNTYLVNFPYIETISKDSKLKSFLINVGIKESINDKTIIACIDRIHKNEVSPLPDNLIHLILKLIQFISCHEDCADTIYVLSMNNTLKRPNQLFISPLSVLEDITDDTSIFIHDSINQKDAFKLGVKLYEELFSFESDINEEDFGIEEEITDRIQTLVRELPVESLIKELIQNAEDSGATEIVFILDEQDYSSHNKTLSLSSTVYPNWKQLHSFPSLTVFNNKGFSEEDIKGIQKLSVGGKINHQNTIGKFGLGFNSVYHITDAPSFITHQQDETGLHFCCFDPFLKYTTTNWRRKDGKKRGKRFCIEPQNLAKFDDQLFPFTFEQFSDEPILSCLSSIKSNGDFSMFRFPLDIEKFASDILESSVHTKHIPYRKVESRKHCSMKDVETMLIKQINKSSEILLFLKSVKSLKVVKIDKFTRKVTLLCSQSIKILEEDSIPRPIWFPAGNNQDIIVHKMESTSITNQSIMKTHGWLIYIHPEISIEEYLKIDNTMSDHSKKLIEEKLWGFGGIAVCISSRKHDRHSTIFNFLPIGATINFPVHINAPLYTDSSRQNVHYEQSELSKDWHNSVIHNILSPLYTLLLVELRSPIVPVVSLDEKIEYFKWFYSLFPSTSTSNIKFISDLSEQLYNFLYMTNQAIFLAHNLDIFESNIIWYNIHGPDCGILLPNSFFHISKVPESPPHPQAFKYPVHTPYLSETESLKVSTEKDEIRRFLIKINLPLTCAPLVLKERFKDSKISQLNPTLLLTYLNENLRFLFQDTDSPRNLTSSILSFKQLESILEYVLTAEPEVFDTCDIPIRIDIHGNFQLFKTSEQCFRSTYAALLPHRSEIFISTDYSLEIIIELLNLHFVEEINVKFLAEHISVDEFEDISICCPLFWKFVNSKNLPVKELKASFGIHELVPLSSYIQSTPIQFCPINKLEFIVSPTLNENDSILYSALSKLRCPILDGNYIKLALSYLDTIAISGTQTSEVIINSISLSDHITADLETEEVSRLLQIIDQVKNHQFDPDKVPFLCSLKIFKTQSGEFLPLSQCEICFINDVNLNLGPVLLVELLRINQLVIFVNNYSKLITSLCRQARKPLLNVSELLSQMIFPLLNRIPVEEQKNIIVFISQNIDGRNNLKHLIDTLANIAFVTSDDGRKLRFNQFYSPEMLFFTKFLSHTTLPKIWRDDNIRFLINKLGLHQKVSLKIIHDVIVKFSQEKFPSSDLPELFEAFIPILYTIDYRVSSNITILQQIAEIQFLNVWKIDCITNPDVSYFPYLARFCDAELLEFQNCCCTISWIHSIDFTLPTTCYQYLGISERPDISTVKEHLIKIINQITQVHSILDIPTCYEKYFLESYNILEKYTSGEYQSADVSLTELNGIHSILWDMNLYYPINMLISSNEILLPFVIQLPATLAGKFPKFFKQIGVEETATYRHFALVLMEIATLLQRSNEKLSESDYLLQTEKVFNSFITALRTFEIQNLPFNLDLNQTLLLTRDCRLISSPDVIFADNLSLLSRVNKLAIAVNILKPLEPDENKSCIPPNCLRLNKLTQLITEELDPNVLLNNTIPPTPFSQILQRTLNCPVVLRCMRRLYFHLTKKDLENLFLNNGETCFSDDSSPPPGFQPFSQILNRLRVVSVTYINTIITDKRQTPHIPYPLDNSCSCYIDETTNTFLIAEKNSSRCLQKDIAFAINSYLGGIFTNVLSNFELCFMLDPYEIMEKLDEYNIDGDPWPIPRQPPFPPSPPASSGTCDSLVVSTHSYSTPRLRTRPQPRGVSIGEPDLPAAKLWFMIAQCDVIAARKLVNQTADCVNAFPSHACFFCFESVAKVFTALLHFMGSKERLDLKHNLRVHIDRLRFLIAEDVCTEIEELTIPLMNYDIDTRIPNSTLVHCIPQQLISLEQSREAIRNAECIITLVTEKFSVMREMKLDSNDPIFRCLPSAQPTLITAVLRFDVGGNLKQVRLDTGDEEFKAIARCFHNSMPYCEILSIEKVFNPNSWNSFKEKLVLESNRNPDSCLSIRFLFHGSGDTSPQLIINDPVGLNMRFAHKGLWGRGLYFATNCSYSHSYSHVVQENVFSVFVATVFVGYVKEMMNEDKNITAPPFRANGIDRYHSVQGRKHGEVIHIIYENCMAYPSHLITYTN